MTVDVNLTFHDVSEYLTGRLFIKMSRLRIYNGEGIELFEEDLRYVKDLQVLYASPNGEDFDSQASFKEYKIMKVLGEGGFGKVMLGRHKLTHENVAIKILNTSTIGNAEDIDIVFREAQLLQSLNHRNIVKIFKCYTLSNMKVVFVMEYLEGGELLQYLKEKQILEEEEVKIYVRQIVDAINYCHNQNLIHRDLKLENILLKSSKQKEVSSMEKIQIKIIDFGISGISTFSPDNINAGSLMYMAPEVILGEIKFVGPPIDIWAIGVMIYALLCGTLPFQGETQQDIIKNIIQSSPTYPDNLSSLCKHLMQKIFVADPKKRIKLIDILKHPWLMDSNIKEQQRQKEIFSKRESQLQSGLNLDTSLELIRLYGGFRNHRRSIKVLTKNKHLIPTNVSYNLSPMKDSAEMKRAKVSSLDQVDEYKGPVVILQIPNMKRKFQKHYNAQQTVITKRYSKVLDVFKVMDKLSKSLSPRSHDLLPQSSNTNISLPNLKQTQPFLKFNQKVKTQVTEPENNLYFIGNKVQVNQKKTHKIS